jgi:hypothetical protein
LTVGQTGDTVSGNVLTEVYDQTGTPLFTFPATVSGNRIKLAPLPR